MNEIIFTSANYGILPAWFLLVFLPRAKVTVILVHKGIIPALFSMLYLTLIIISWGKGEGDMGSLKGVSLLFSHPQTLLAGWIHYIVFDCLIAAYMVRDAAKRGIKHYFIIPSLLLTLAFGPIGYLSYWIIAQFKRN